MQHCLVNDCEISGIQFTAAMCAAILLSCFGKVVLDRACQHGTPVNNGKSPAHHGVNEICIGRVALGSTNQLLQGEVKVALVRLCLALVQLLPPQLELLEAPVKVLRCRQAPPFIRHGRLEIRRALALLLEERLLLRLVLLFQGVFAPREFLLHAGFHLLHRVLERQVRGFGGDHRYDVLLHLVHLLGLLGHGFAVEVTQPLFVIGAGGRLLLEYLCIFFEKDSCVVRAGKDYLLGVFRRHW